MADYTSTRDTEYSQSALELMVHHAALKYHLDPTIFRSLIQRESNFKPDAVSSKGAIGMGQLMPETATKLKVNPYDPAENIEGAARYLRQQLDAFGGDYRLAAAAYNWGPGNVQKYGLDGAPPSVTSYVSDVLSGTPPSNGGTPTKTATTDVPSTPSTGGTPSYYAPPFYPMGGMDNNLMGRQQNPLDKFAMIGQLMHLFSPNSTATAGSNTTQALLQALARAGQSSHPNPLLGGSDTF